MNPIEIPVSELKAALPGLKQIISRKGTLPVLGCVRVCRLKNGRLTLQATDLDATATYATQVRAGDESCVVIVPGEELGSVLKGAAKDDTIQLVPDAKQPKLRHCVAGSWLEKPLPLFKDDEWPPMVGLDSDPMPLPPELPATLKSSFGFAADESRLPLHGAWLDVEDPQAHYVMAANGRALFTANSFTFGLKESLLVPYHRFLEWDGFQGDGPWQLRVKPKQEMQAGHLQLDSDHWTYVAKLPEVTHVNWRDAVPGERKTRIRFSEDTAKALLELLPKLPGKDQQNCRCELQFSETRSTVTGREPDHHSTVELHGLKVDGPDVAIAVNRTYVSQALKLGLRELDLIDELSPLVFHTGGRRLVVMPLRPDPMPATTTTPPEGQTADPAPEATAQPTPTNPNTTTPAPMSKETHTPPAPTTETLTALKQAIAQVENLKATVKGMLTDLNDVLKTLHVAKKEKRATEKEVEEVRAALESVKRLRL